MTLHIAQTTATARAGTRLPDPSQRRRAAEAIAFVAVWMAAGYLLPISSDGYLLLGIPLTVAFQLFVRRRPLRTLFAPATSRFAWDGKALAMVAAPALLPAVYAVGAVRSHDCVVAGWYLAAAVGAVCAAFALRTGTVLGALRSAALPIAIGATGMALVYSAIHIRAGVPLSAAAAVAAVVKYTALYFPVTFLLEEVSSRGGIDPPVHGDHGQRSWRSATFVSALWGLWHLPVSQALPLPLQAVELVVVHVPLSFAWRRPRNLAGPALAHAANDAVRNAFMLGL